MHSECAIPLDAGFVAGKLQAKRGDVPTAASVDQECQRIVGRTQFANRDLLRICF